MDEKKEEEIDVMVKEIEESVKGEMEDREEKVRIKLEILKDDVKKLRSSTEVEEVIEYLVEVVKDAYYLGQNFKRDFTRFMSDEIIRWAKETAIKKVKG